MTTNKRIIAVLVFISLLFLSLLGYLTYFVLFKSAAVAANPYNKRNQIAASNIVRGSIFDRNGVVLAKSDNGNRIYPFAGLYSGVIGYNSPLYGNSGLEKTYDSTLLAKSNILLLQPTEGNSVYLSLDNNLQTIAQNALNNRNGAAVVINPQTGEILALASYPNFDPNESALDANWNSLSTDSNTPLLPRATQGLYEPGSTFKIITSSALLANGENNLTFNDTGFTTIGGKVFTNYASEKNGQVDLTKAFEVSSNVAFCTWGSQLGITKLYSMVQQFGFTSPISIDIPVSNSQFPQVSMTDADVAAASMGQWNDLATPLEMARIAGIIANGGKDIPLHLVSKTVNKDGVVLTQANTALGKQILDPNIAATLQTMMEGVVQSGTASSLANFSPQVAGKTGTAENNIPNKEHTWFVGFAPANNPTIAIAVVLENSGGTGSSMAVPIAKQILQSYFGN